MTDSSNKDEAARCVRIAEAALASDDRERALKFIKIARRLDHNIPVEVLLTACNRLDDAGTKISTEQVSGIHAPKGPSSSTKSSTGSTDCDKNYTEEHLRLIREISRSNDYYAVLGVERSCSGEEIRRAYRKLSLKVHPDKNKAPGAEEAFKTICRAFKCLSDEEARRVYDQTGSAGDFEINQHYGGMRRRRRARATRNDFVDDDFDADEIFRSFFGYQSDTFRAHRVHRARGAPRQRRNSNEDAEGLGFLSLVQILPIFIIFMLVFLPYSEPEYFLRQSYTYHIPKISEKHGVEYYVRSEDFDQKYPQGSSSREKLEDDIFRDYMGVLRRYCNIELQRRQRLTNYPTHYCDKLRDLMAA